MIFQSVTSKKSDFVSCLHSMKKQEEIRICFSLCMFANLHKGIERIFHQMKTRLSLGQINSAAWGNHRKPRGC